jgi:probable rRNA maturation factor
VISISVEDGRWTRAVPALHRTCRAACEAALAEGGGTGDIALMLADDEVLRDLNQRFRNIDKPTNVLSFPADEGYLGDIAIALETTRREAKEQEKSVSAHLSHLVVHGVLHLLGHDHEVPAQAEAMEALERLALARLGIADPYEGAELAESGLIG